MMNGQISLMPRAERPKPKKEKSVAYYFLIEQGFIIFIPFVIYPANEDVGAALLIVFILILPFLTKNKIVMLFSNASILTLLLLFLYLADMNNMNSDLNILFVLSMILTVLLIFLVQTFVIFIKVYSIEPENCPNVNKAKWYFKLIVKIVYYSNLIIDKVSLLLPLLYYAFITFLIIYIYAVLYNGLNYFYEIHDEQAGYYMSTELFMNDNDDLGDSIYINYGSSLEQNNSIRIPIVDIRYDKSIQSHGEIMKQITDH